MTTPFQRKRQEQHDDSRQQSSALDTTSDDVATLQASLMTVPERLDFLQKQVDALKRRNFEKDRGKEFESSYTRVIFLMIITYCTLCAYMAFVLKTGNPFLDAIVPTVGFNISTWSLPYIKELWIQGRHYYMHGETESSTLQREEALRLSSRNLDLEEGDDAATGTPDEQSFSSDEDEA